MTETVPHKRLLDHSTLWPLYVAVILCTCIVAWRGYMYVQGSKLAQGEAPSPVATNGFDLSRATVSLKTIQQHGAGFEGLKAITSPESLTPDAFARRRRNKVVDRDRVIGVELNGEARVYPLRIIAWHEIVNDELGGVAIAVTYCGLSDTVRVFEREIDGKPVQLRFSGLVHNSSTLLYDYGSALEENSLWRQVDGVAVCGPGAVEGRRMKTVSSKLLPYGEWKALHPETTIIDGIDKKFRSLYGKYPYHTYFQGGKLLYNVDPLPPSDSADVMTRTLIAKVGDEETYYWYPTLLEHTKTGPWETTISGIPVQIHTSRQPDCAWITTDSPAPELDTWNSMWFAYYALKHAQ